MIEKVITLNDGNLLLGESAHDINEVFCGDKQLSENSLINFRNNIKYRKERSDDFGASYKHFIFPEKTCLFKSQYPLNFKNSIVDLSLNYFSSDVIDLTSSLELIDQPFLKTDTHLSFDGEVQSSIEILSNFFSIDREDTFKLFNSFKGEPEFVACDLGSKLEPVIRELRYPKITPNIVRYHNRAGVNDGLFIVCLNKKMIASEKSKRLLIFGDSFMEFNLQFISHFYSEVLYCRTRFFHEELVMQFKPDHIISENAERYLTSIPSDVDAPNFTLLYGMRGVNSGDAQKAYQMLNAQLKFGGVFYSKFIHNWKSEFCKNLAG